MTTSSRTVNSSTVPTANKICGAGLLIAAAGVLIQYLVLPEDFPTVPPGPIVLTVAAGVVVLGARWWWSPLVGVAVALMIAVGGFLSGNLGDNLTGSAGSATGAVVMFLGLAAAVVAGAAAMLRHRDAS